ncbi:MAG TPA: Maf family protein [Candidatus Solibacter sp.]|nr:Maf family protein [Candidatus Solibacter sp.]
MLVLASASPRRQELLRNAGISFEVQPADVDETPAPGEAPLDCAIRLARDKALKVWASRPQDFVLGADTVVVIDDVILGKPADVHDAASMLRMLSGHSHRVITGVCLVKAQSGETKCDSATTLVTMTQLTDEEIRAYVATGEPTDKAGAYAIQGMASKWIPRIEGDYSNVVGLPVALVYRMLQDAGGI